MKFRSRNVIAAAVAGSILVVGGITAQGAYAEDGRSASAPGKAHLKAAAKKTVTYSDAELLELLLAAQGPIAEAHPELKQMLGFNPDKAHTDEEALNQIITGYLAARPGFHRDVAAPFHSGDPVRVGAALRDFSVSFNKWIKENAEPAKSGKAEAQASGWFYMGAYVAIYANAVGVANAAVYANAAVATNALATVVIITWYLEDGSPTGSGIERDAFVDALTSALT